ncbi:MAG: c-type cytochrome domain-containing protein, partial [Planctomycetaceae bacterium]
MARTLCRFWIGIIVVGCLFATQQAVDADDTVLFEMRIRPLLIKHCLECHGIKKQESGLRLDSRAGWMRGGDSGPAIIPGEADSSLLIKAVRHSDPDRRMPADRQKLTAMQISDLATWIDKGAFDPRQASDNGASDSRMSL